MLCTFCVADLQMGDSAFRVPQQCHLRHPARRECGPLSMRSPICRSEAYGDHTYNKYALRPELSGTPHGSKACQPRVSAPAPLICHCPPPRYLPSLRRYRVDHPSRAAAIAASARLAGAEKMAGTSSSQLQTAPCTPLAATLRLTTRPACHRSLCSSAFACCVDCATAASSLPLHTRTSASLSLSLAALTPSPRLVVPTRVPSRAHTCEE